MYVEQLGEPHSDHPFYRSRVLCFIKARWAKLTRGHKKGLKKARLRLTSVSSQRSALPPTLSGLSVQCPAKLDSNVGIALLNLSTDARNDSECIILHDNLPCCTIPDFDEYCFANRRLDLHSIMEGPLMQNNNYSPSQYRSISPVSFPQHNHPPWGGYYDLGSPTLDDEAQICQELCSPVSRYQLSTEDIALHSSFEDHYPGERRQTFSDQFRFPSSFLAPLAGPLSPLRRRSLIAKEVHEREYVAHMRNLAPDDIDRIDINNSSATPRKAGRLHESNTEGTNAPQKYFSAYLVFLQYIRENPRLIQEIFGHETAMTKQSVLAVVEWRSMTDGQQRPFLA